MRRKEVVLAGEVFGLGLKEFDEAVTKERHYSRMLDVEVGARRFQCRVSLADRAFIVHWVSRTSLANIIWTRFVAFRLKWPLARSISCFIYAWDGM